MIEKEIIKAYALENAVLHKGKAVAGPIVNALFSVGLEKKDMKTEMPRIQEVLKEVNSMSLKEQEEELSKVEDKLQKREEREGLPELPNVVDGKVVTRFAPFPSGALHIGNARTAVLNDEYAKNYNGKMILVIDDTIGSEDKPLVKEAYDLIPEGLDWLDTDYDKKIIYKSDRLEKYYAYAKKLIEKGYMYVCDCSQEEFKKLKDKGIECSCRNLSPLKHLDRWDKMFSSSVKEGEMVVRLKTSMQDPDPAFRDRVMFRICNRRHIRVGNKYQVWPLLDFSWAIDNHLLGVTHVLRGVDLMMETRVEEFIRNIFSWPNPEVIYNGHLAIEGVKISKSKGVKEVKKGEYIGWNDPRLWSLQALRDRGIQPEAVREFILGMGVKKSNTKIAIDVLYALNRKYVEDAPRYFYVENPVKIHIKNSEDLDVKLPKHPSKELGFREFKTSMDFYISEQDAESIVDGEYRFIHLFNFTSSKLNALTEREYRFESLESDNNIKMLHWLPVNQYNYDVKIVMPDGSHSRGLAEEHISELKKGDVVQFERFGFCCLNSIDKEKQEAVFFFCHS